MDHRSIISIAIDRAILEEFSDKKRIRILRRTTELLGHPSVVPLLTKSHLSELEKARELWAQLLPELMDGAAK